MPELEHPPYSYRTDPDVPKFDDSKALFVFDGVCVLCSGGAAWIMRHDRKAKVNFTSAQSPLGQALYRHYGMEIDESYLFITEGKAFTGSAGYLRLCTTLGGWWRLLRLGALIPEGWRDAVYAAIARNRYSWFGRTVYCALLTEEQRGRLI